MELQRVLKKFIASLLLMIMLISQLEGLRLQTEAVTVTSKSGANLYLALTAMRDQMGHAIDMSSNGQNGKQLWGIRSYQTASPSSSSVVSSNLYCIKAGFGHTWEDLQRPTEVLTYSSSTFNASAVDGYYNELLWIIDHLYVPGEDNKDQFLRSIGIDSYEDSGYKIYFYDPDLTPGYNYSDLGSSGEYAYTLTDDDIISIQQGVIWYYTNYKINPSRFGIYNKVGNSSRWLKYTTNGTNYNELHSYNSGTGEGPGRNEFAVILYNYLIEAATKEVQKAGGTYTLKNKSVKLWTSNVNGGEEQPIIEVHKKQKSGEYDLILVKQDENGQQLNSTATFTVNNTDKTVTGKLTVASKVSITSSNVGTKDKYIIKEKTPPDEYCPFDGTIEVTVTKGDTGDKYAATQVTYVVKDAAGNDITAQTGSDVKVYLKDGNIYVEVKNYPEEKAFDLALRKAIVEVKNNQGVAKSVINEKEQNATRNIVIDRSTLNNEDDDRSTDTATYRHRKDPVLVEKGDKVKYSLTIYNEGEQAGYARKIVDQLPGTSTAGLRLISTNDVTSSTGNVYSVAYSTTTNTVTLALKSTSPRTIPAYNGTTLSQEKIELECQVMATADSTRKMTLTNIAYISEEYNSETNEMITTTGDRDSQPAQHPTYQGENDTKQDGITYGTDIGYKGNASNPTDLSQNNTYYKGQQDDDDFEKLVILPKAFDLSLRKVIKEVDGVSTGSNREINITGLNELSAGTKTTAQYNHIKEPVLVKYGSKVKYNINIYNEADIDGIATIIKDQLPSGLKLDLTSLQTQVVGGTTQYYVKTAKNNKYIVTYDETTNMITFTLDTTAAITNLQAFSKRTTIDSDTIEFNCTVRAIADEKSNIYLTNIAYIYEEKDEDGTIITNQKGKDRDSEPYTRPNKTADELTTVDDIGYTGNSGNPTDLAKPNTYYKGEQDDDDFEKLVILPKAFDLSLRKVIKEVDGVSTGSNREINITGLNELSAGTKTTAQYNHIKEPVLVKYGSKVKYNINIYNEADIDGIATIIKDQLPSGLKLDLTSLQTQVVGGTTQYYVKTAKNNKYIVTYDETTNMITFTLDTTAAITNLQAFSKRTTIDSDTIEFNCTVRAIADEKSNIYLTNIAYIYEEKDEDGTIITNQKGKDRDSEPYTRPNKTADELTTVDDIGYTGNSGNPTDLAKPNTYYKGEQDDDDFEKLVILPQAFDLKLIKYIDEINGEDAGNRILSVDTTKLNKTGADGKRITTAEYEMEKNPISVRRLDFIKYTFRIYNEGDYDGYATEISEDIPDGLEALIVERDTSNNIVIYSWDGKNIRNITQEIKTTGMYDEIVATNNVWKYNKNTSIITTDGLKDQLIKAFGIKNYSNYADKENMIDYKEISVIFRVKENAVITKKAIRNEAAITEDKAVDDKGNEIIDSDGNPIDDRDSTPDKWGKEDSGKDYNDDGWEIYKEDDEDYDNIILQKFDLSLRKQITKITRNGKDTLYTGRYAKLDPVNSKENTIYNYYNVYDNKPKVRPGDIVTYSIRVYNEGEIDGYAKLIADALPSGLEFVPYTKGDGSINDKYGWKLVEGTTNVYETDYLSYENDTNKGTENSTLIKAYTGSGEADYQEVEIQCRVKLNVNKSDSLLNVAQIADDSDEKGKPIKDEDSEPGKKDDEKKWKEEDDLDIEILELEEFDLALRKFITQIEETGRENSKTEDGTIKTTDVTSRIPEVNYNKETGKITYSHTKDPLIVHVKDTVIYTIRVYNEGDIDGYAQEVTDDIPEYLEFLPNHQTNRDYEWEMYDAEGNKTEDVTKAVKIKTIHLAKGEGAEKGAKEGEDNYTANLIKSFNPEAGISQTNPDYRDLKVAFKVKDPDSSEFIIRNFAQISEDGDENGDPVDDIDSDPDNGEKDPKEDDEDIENVKVEYFDLALLKYVTKAIVTEDGKEVITETGNIGDENDIVPKVEINKKKIDKTVVKFAYTIKITNEGNIAGYAKEITDYIPEGLEFKAEDNPNWIDEGNRIISTRLLENVLLQPGQSAEVEVILTWINGENNLGSKINIAEISEDDNEEDVPDKDSTPDNKEEGEDDIDEAEVILSIKTGGGINQTYTNITLTLLLISIVGIILIKKYML